MKFRWFSITVESITFILSVKELANEFEGQFQSIQESNEIYKSFTVLTKKEVIKIDKSGNKSVETLSYKMKLIDSMRFMGTLLSKLIDNVTGGIHEIECKDCGCFFEYENVKDNLIKYECLSCNKE